MTIVTAAGATLLLLGLNALFVAAEFSLLSTRRTQLEPAADAGSKAARLALKAIENVNLTMAAAQLGITMTSLGLGAISEPMIARLLVPLFTRLEITESLVHPLASAIALTFIVFLHVVYGEMVPKNVALATPERSALWLGPFMIAMIVVLKPVVIALNATANGAVRLFGIQPQGEVVSTFGHDEVASFVEEAHREGLLDADEYELVTGALDFQGGTVADVLLPTDTLVTISAETTSAQIEELCAETGYSRFPVMDAAGNLSGYLHIKDVLETDPTARDIPVADRWLRPLGTLSRDTGLVEALRSMQERGSHLAQVAEADGTTAGVVMLEDVLEELVGEIHDRI